MATQRARAEDGSVASKKALHREQNSSQLKICDLQRIIFELRMHTSEADVGDSFEEGCYTSELESRPLQLSDSSLVSESFAASSTCITSRAAVCPCFVRAICARRPDS